MFSSHAQKYLGRLDNLKIIQTLATQLDPYVALKKGSISGNMTLFWNTVVVLHLQTLRSLCVGVGPVEKTPSSRCAVWERGGRRAGRQGDWAD